ncbi:MAG TPA: inorganic diphosphatase [Terriglobales bacterium]|nr:inorganic diphosphatase [Terriglobales bacterium]
MKKQSENRTAASSDPNQGRTLRIIVETPRACRNKYKYEQKTGRLKLSKVMPEGMVFPYEFGFIPGTLAQDGDPLDVLVLTDEPTFPGCELDCRVLGVIKAEQTQDGKQSRNDRLIAVAVQSLIYGQVEELSDLDETVLRQIEAFFVNYQKVRNIDFKILAREGVNSAMEMVERAQSRRAA